MELRIKKEFLELLLCSYLFSWSLLLVIIQARRTAAVRQKELSFIWWSWCMCLELASICRCMFAYLCLWFLACNCAHLCNHQQHLGYCYDSATRKGSCPLVLRNSKPSIPLYLFTLSQQLLKLQWYFPCFSSTYLPHLPFLLHLLVLNQLYLVSSSLPFPSSSSVRKWHGICDEGRDRSVYSRPRFTQPERVKGAVTPGN